MLALPTVSTVLHAQSISSPNYTAEDANISIHQAEQYVNSINQSGYLIFYPNLSQAYSYINTAKRVYLDSPSSAVLYAEKAKASAKAAYDEIDVYRRASLLLMIVFTLVVAIALNKFMRPINKKRVRVS